MAKTNKLQRNVTSTNPFVSGVTLPGVGGVFGANPAPGFREYPETKGQTLPPTKFAHTDIAPSKGTKVNDMERNVETPSIAEAIGLQTPGTTKIISGRNRYQTSVKSTNILNKK